MTRLSVTLASASPRRLELLRACGLDVDVRPAHVDERRLPGESPVDTVLRLARLKAAAVAGAVVVGADTEVVLDGVVLGKPADAADAARMLRRLAGRSHEVITGWCVRSAKGERGGAVHTEVAFRPLTDTEIAVYVDSGEPLDKAGAYGIQGRGGALVDVVRGSYPNVVGLPVREVVEAIRELAP